jgi:tetratricopeptide (TPR) repeat protein
LRRNDDNSPMSAPTGFEQLRAQLAREPQSVDARIGMARLHIAAGDLPTATAWCSDACRVAPASAPAAAMLGELLMAQQLYGQALPVYQRLYHALGARDRATLLHYGYCLEMQGDVDGAIALYREALAVDPAFLEAHVDLAGVLWRVGDFDGALHHAQQAAAIGPEHAHAVRIVGTALLQLNRLDEAEQQLRRALAIKPDFALARVDLAFTLLLAGRYAEGWAAYEQRWNDPRLKRPAYWSAATEWPGPRVPLEGQRLVVYTEQGLGDTIQFVRYLPMLQALGAKVHAVVQPELVQLVEHSFPGVSCRPPQQDLYADWHVALLGLPARFGTTLATVPAGVPYLQVPHEHRALWRRRMSVWDGKVKVGLAWSGMPRHVNDRNRSMPLGAWRPLLAMPGVQCFSLQKGDTGVYGDIQPAPGELADLTPHWRDFCDSAAMVAELDLVIAVDTSAIHLAGALGKPAWLLLPPNPDFRWLLDRDDSPWYPALRLFRRAAAEPRDAQVARVMRALDEWLAQRR